jgi:hypothetical protein
LEKWLPTESWNFSHAYHPVLVSIQSGLKTLISDTKLWG